jgi:hypothetical protein
MEASAVNILGGMLSQSVGGIMSWMNSGAGDHTVGEGGSGAGEREDGDEDEWDSQSQESQDCESEDAEDVLDSLEGRGDVST